MYPLAVLTFSTPDARSTFTCGLCCLGPVDKVDSQLAAIVIQDCFWGGSFGSRFDDGQGVGVYRAIRDREWRQERSGAGGSPAGAGWRVLDRAHGCSLA